MLLVLFDVNARMVLSPVETIVGITNIHNVSSKTPWKRKSDVTRTAGPVAVVSEIALVKAAPDARFLPHLVNLRHAQLRVGLEKQFSRLDCEVVLRPVP